MADPAPQNCDAVKKSCMEVIEAADKVIAEQKAGLDLRQKAIDSCNNDNGRLRVDLQEAQESASAWYRSPVFVGVTGALVGILAYSYLTKK